MKKIFENIEHTILNSGNKEIKYCDIHYDSRKIKENDIFAALEGFTVDGHKYIDKAIENGAKMIIVSKDVEVIDRKITYIKVENLRNKLGEIASNYYGNPQDKLNVIGVTGTNGKTRGSRKRISKPWTSVPDRRTLQPESRAAD